MMNHSSPKRPQVSDLFRLKDSFQPEMMVRMIDIGVGRNVMGQPKQQWEYDGDKNRIPDFFLKTY